MSPRDESPVVVLLGGGIESTRLVRDFLREGRRVIPFHVSCGLIWDRCELQHIQRFLKSRSSPLLLPLIDVEIPMNDYLGSHWAVTGANIPKAGADSDELEIPLRNLLLLSLTIPKLRRYSHYDLALGTTADNSYRDGSRAYFNRCESVLSLEAGHPVKILTPLIALHKAEVIRGCDQEALAMSFSCVNPQDGRHCGACIKCGRRKSSFREAGVPDPTLYASDR